MRFSRNLLVSSRLLLVVSVLVFCHEVTASPKPPPPVVTTPGSIKSEPGAFDLLQKVIYDKELSKPESLKSKLGVQKSNPRNPASIQKSNHAPKKSLPKTSKKSTFRTEILRQELSKESQENCLSKLLCGEGSDVTLSLRNNETSGVLKDYGLLVKEFLDIFSDDPVDQITKAKPIKNKDEQNEVDDDDQEEDDDDEDDVGRSGEKFVNISTSLVSEPEEIITTSSTSTVSSITTGATITELYPNPVTFTTSASTTTTTTNNPVDASESNKITLEEVVSDDDRAKKKDLNNGRKSRYLEFALSFGNEQRSRYINKKIREMRSAKTNAEKLMIAGKIATRLREPRQCRQFENVASQILSTCPLTAEVVRYFNSNLKNGTQIALLKQNQNATKTGGGLVVLNDRGGVPHPYFLDNSPIIANTYVNTDLKNPSVGDRFPLSNTNKDSIRNPIYENAYPQKFNTAIVSLANDPNKRKNSKKTQVKKDSDEDEAESDENEEGYDDDQEDDDDDDGDNNEERGETRYNNQERSQQKNSKNKLNNNRITIKIKPQFKKDQTTQQQTRQIPQKKGVIKVYGVYQPSFDSEFSQTSTQIGAGPLHFFDHDDDGVDVRYQNQKPASTSSGTTVRKPKPVVPPPKKTKVVSKPVDVSDQSSNSDEEDDEEEQEAEEEEEDQEEHQDEEEDPEEDEDDVDDYKKRSIVIQKSPSQKQLQQNRRLNPAYRRPHDFATTPNYGSFPAPRREEYYHNGKPLRPRPPTQPMYTTPMIYKPRPELRRLNIVHAPGSALLRPAPTVTKTRRGHYQRY